MNRKLAIMAASAAALALTPPALAKLDTRGRGTDLENWWNVKTQSMSLALREIIRLPDSATPSGGKS